MRVVLQEYMQAITLLVVVVASLGLFAWQIVVHTLELINERKLMSLVLQYTVLYIIIFLSTVY